MAFAGSPGPGPAAAQAQPGTEALGVGRRQSERLAVIALPLQGVCWGMGGVGRLNSRWGRDSPAVFAGLPAGRPGQGPVWLPHRTKSTKLLCTQLSQRVSPRSSPEDEGLCALHFPGRLPVMWAYSPLVGPRFRRPDGTRSPGGCPCPLCHVPADLIQKHRVGWSGHCNPELSGCLWWGLDSRDSAHSRVACPPSVVSYSHMMFPASSGSKVS